MSKKSAGIDEIDPRVLHTRISVLTAASNILVELGPDSLTIDEVIRRTSIARMTIYRHWSSREELILDAFRFLVPSPGYPEGFRPGKNSLENLKRGVIAYGKEFATANWAAAMPGLLRLAAKDEKFNEIKNDFAGARGQHMVGLILECQSAGYIKNVDVDVAISQLIGPISFRRFLSFEPITKQFCERLVRDFVAANS